MISSRLHIITSNSVEPSDEFTGRMLDRCRDGLIAWVEGESQMGAWRPDIPSFPSGRSISEQGASSLSFMR